MSQYHFHRLFKKIVGVTPKQYQVNLRSNRFQRGLTKDQSITEAIYEAGYGSGSGAYSKHHDKLAMEPKIYRNGAKGITITYGITQCFLGRVIVAATERGICAVEFGDDDSKLLDYIRERFPKAGFEKGGSGYISLFKRVVEYVEHPNQKFDLPLDIQGTVFQQKVWNVLMTIKPGQTMSYSDVAEQIGNPKSVRAVAAACAANKIGVVIPCHRVLGKDGTISGYRWGIERKKRLLENENM